MRFSGVLVWPCCELIIIGAGDILPECLLFLKLIYRPYAVP